MNKKQIGKLIAQQVKAKQLNTSEVYKRTGIISNQLKDISNGDSNYTIDKLLQLCELLNLKLYVSKN